MKKTAVAATGNTRKLSVSTTVTGFNRDQNLDSAGGRGELADLASVGCHPRNPNEIAGTALPAGFASVGHAASNCCRINMVPPAGVEPATYGLGIRRSIQLSYGGTRLEMFGLGPDFLLDFGPSGFFLTFFLTFARPAWGFFCRTPPHPSFAVKYHENPKSRHKGAGFPTFLTFFIRAPWGTRQYPQGDGASQGVLPHEREGRRSVRKK